MAAMLERLCLQRVTSLALSLSPSLSDCAAGALHPGRKAATRARANLERKTLCIREAHAAHIVGSPSGSMGNTDTQRMVARAGRVATLHYEPAERAMPITTHMSLGGQARCVLATWLLSSLPLARLGVARAGGWTCCTDLMAISSGTSSQSTCRALQCRALRGRTSSTAIDIYAFGYMCTHMLAPMSRGRCNGEGKLEM